MMECPRCRAQNREGRRFCAECAAPLASSCPSCGFANEPGEKFCGGCAAPLTTVTRIPEPRFTAPQAYTPKHLAEKIHATGGNWEAGVQACERALELAPDPFETAGVLACLGKALAEAGNLTRAVPVLERAVQLGDQVRSRQWREWFRTLLGEGYFLSGQMDKAREAAQQALKASTDFGYSLGIGWAQQVLGRVAQARGAGAEAEQHLVAALNIFASVHSRFEAGRTHLFLASCAHARGNHEAAATHVQAAHAVFRAARVPKYVERAEALARELGAGLST